MNFFDKIHETQLTRRTSRPMFPALSGVPLLALQSNHCKIARAAAREVLG